MKQHPIYKLVVVGGIALLGTPQASGAANAPLAPPDCKSLERKPALLVEVEYCAKLAHPTDSESAHAAFLKRSTNHTYKVKSSQIKDPAFAKRVKAHFGVVEAVAFVADPAPAWLPRENASPIQLGGGGDSLASQVVLSCVIGAPKGHYEVTEASVSPLWGAGAAAFMGAMTREADAYEWSNPSAHAQTGHKTGAKYEVEAGDPNAAIKSFETYVRDNMSRVLAACRKAPPSAVEMGYFMSYVLHAAQDLATHHGITNAEHSYLARYVSNPDADSVGVVRAAMWTDATLDAMKRRLSQPCRDAMKTLTPSSRVSSSLRELTFGDMDGGPGPLWDYWSLGKVYKEALQNNRPNLQVTWFTPTNAIEAQAFLTTHVLNVIAAAP